MTKHKKRKDIEIHFDVNTISEIEFRPMMLKAYTWHDQQLIPKTIFGIKTGGVKVIASGFRDDRMKDVAYEDEYVFPESKESIEEAGLIVINREVYSKARVTITMENKTEISKEFQTEDEAIQFIDDIKSISKKTFKVVKY